MTFPRVCCIHLCDALAGSSAVRISSTTHEGGWGEEASGTVQDNMNIRIAPPQHAGNYAKNAFPRVRACAAFKGFLLREFGFCRLHLPVCTTLVRCMNALTLQGRVPLETAEQRANEEEVVEKTTTQMYRAPEMVDLYLERELTEKVDVWVSVGVGDGRFPPRPGCCLCVVAFLVLYGPPPVGCTAARKSNNLSLIAVAGPPTRGVDQRDC